MAEEHIQLSASFKSPPHLHNELIQTHHLEPLSILNEALTLEKINQASELINKLSVLAERSARRLRSRQQLEIKTRRRR